MELCQTALHATVILQCHHYKSPFDYFGHNLIRVWWWFDDDLRLITTSDDTYTHIQIHVYTIQIHIYVFMRFYVKLFILLTLADVQFYAILQVKIFSSLWIAWREEFEAEIQIHGIYILPIESIHTRVGLVNGRNTSIRELGNIFSFSGKYLRHISCVKPSPNRWEGVCRVI